MGKDEYRSKAWKDKHGVEHLVMHFNVTTLLYYMHFVFFFLLCSTSSGGSLTSVAGGLQVEGHIDRGVVNAHLVRRPGEREYAYQYLFLDVSGPLLS